MPVDVLGVRSLPVVPRLRRLGEAKAAVVGSAALPAELRCGKPGCNSTVRGQRGNA